jgi:hypothetical protein
MLQSIGQYFFDHPWFALVWAIGLTLIAWLPVFLMKLGK